jgi:hypothetical protein
MIISETVTPLNLISSGIVPGTIGNHTLSKKRAAVLSLPIAIAAV